MMKNTQQLVSRLQVAAIFLMTAGWGWSAGNFTPAGSPFLNPLAHTLPLIILLMLSLPLLRMRGMQESGGSSRSWARVGVSVFAIISIIGCIVLIVLGASNADPNAVGVKTLQDWFPVVILNMGTFLWLGTPGFARQGRTVARAARAV